MGIIERVCIVCNKTNKVELNNEQCIRYINKKPLPELTAEQREILISGTCGQCFDNMFKE